MTPLTNGHKHHVLASKYEASGLVFFSGSGRLVFINREARMYLRELQPVMTGQSDSSLIPEEIHSLVRQLTSRLAQCEHPKDCETIQVERLCFAAGQRFLVRGLCIPDAPLIRNSHLLIVMAKVNQKPPHTAPHPQHQYHLTEREQMVIIYLMLGFTNKEIASRLNLSEYTVKEHLKRIMHKTNSHTRTSLLARMLFP